MALGRREYLRVLRDISEEAAVLVVGERQVWREAPHWPHAPPLPLAAMSVFPAPSKPAEARKMHTNSHHSPSLQSLLDCKGTGDGTPMALGKGLDFSREGSHTWAD